jgi:hypothetical protein
MANKYDKVLGEYREADTTKETDPISLHLDQPTPQTVTDFFKINTLTAGSVLFGGTDGLLAQDNSKLFWDNSTKRLGVGTTSPSAALHIVTPSGINPSLLTLEEVSEAQWRVYMRHSDGYLTWSRSGLSHAYFIVNSEKNGNSGFAFSGAGDRGKYIADGSYNHTIQPNDYYGKGNLIIKSTPNGTGKVGIGTTSPTAVLHLKAGTSTASTSPLKFTSGTLLETAEVGAIEFLSDDFFATITTGAARKGIILDDGSRLTSGKIPVATTNGRLVDLTAQDTEADLKVDYTSGDLDTEADIITAINTTNAKINSIIAKLKTLGLLATS